MKLSKQVLVEAWIRRQPLSRATVQLHIFKLQERNKCLCECLYNRESHGLLNSRAELFWQRHRGVPRGCFDPSSFMKIYVTPSKRSRLTAIVPRFAGDSHECTSH